jgi:AAHS family 4-hydroxybenzoate transporter-like MFS transporter
MAGKAVSVKEVFDTSPFSTYQIGICVLCFLVVFFDGFDLTVIGVALPKIAETLKTSPAALGLAVSAGLVGPLVGALFLGMLADHWGRKQMLFLSSIVFGRRHRVRCHRVLHIRQQLRYHGALYCLLSP